jgi:hypothetical protein
VFVCTRRESSQRISLVIIVLPATAFIALRVHRGRNNDLHVSFRRIRNGKYSFGRGCSVLELVTFVVFAARCILVASLLAALEVLAMGTLVTTRAKASVHAGVTAGRSRPLIFLSPLGSPCQLGGTRPGVGESLSAPTQSAPSDSGLGDCIAECRGRLSSLLTFAI